MNRGTLSFRRLARSDFPLLQQWLAAPHVGQWWREPFDATSVERRFGPRVEGTEPTHVFVLEADGRPIGWIQWYWWSDYPDHAAQLGAEPGAAGLDLALGDAASVGRGLGSQAIGQFIQEIITPQACVSAIVTDPEAANARSVRAFERAGFVAVGSVTLKSEDAPRRIMRLAVRPLL